MGRLLGNIKDILSDSYHGKFDLHLIILFYPPQQCSIHSNMHMKKFQPEEHPRSNLSNHRNRTNNAIMVKDTSF